MKITKESVPLPNYDDFCSALMRKHEHLHVPDITLFQQYTNRLHDRADELSQVLWDRLIVPLIRIKERSKGG
jgi:hypothetical protein